MTITIIGTALTILSMMMIARKKRAGFYIIIPGNLILIVQSLETATPNTLVIWITGIIIAVYGIYNWGQDEHGV